MKLNDDGSFNVMVGVGGIPLDRCASFSPAPAPSFLARMCANRIQANSR